MLIFPYKSNFQIYKDPRIAWIGNPHQQNCMVEAGTGSLPVKVHP
jgi:hypothetical protein